MACPVLPRQPASRLRLSVCQIRYAYAETRRRTASVVPIRLVAAMRLVRANPDGYPSNYQRRTTRRRVSALGLPERQSAPAIGVQRGESRQRLVSTSASRSRRTRAAVFVDGNYMGTAGEFGPSQDRWA